MLTYEISDSITQSFIVKQDDQGLLKSQKEYERSFISKNEENGTKLTFLGKKRS